MFTVQSIHIAFEIWGSIFSLIAVICIYFSSFREKRKRLLIELQLCAAVLLIMDAVAWGTRGSQSILGYYMVRISNFIVFLASNMLLIFYHSYVCNLLFKNREEAFRLLRVKMVYFLGSIGMLLVVLSQFTNLYYYFDGDNYYHRSLMHPLSLGICFMGMIIDLSLLIQFRKRMERLIFVSMVSYSVLPAGAAVALIFFYGISLVNIAISISVILMFVMAMVEQSKMLAEMEKELAQSQVKVLRSQMQPHFIFNSLIAIKSLCRTDAQGAVDAIDHFSGYLRGSIAVLNEDKPILFRKELEHVKNYLYLEQKRFGERLQVIYDITSDGFWVPAFSIQPIVENAVRHGICQKPEGGCLKISAWEEKDSWMVRVEDDGIGFDIGELDKLNQNHIGIDNVQKRLTLMCNGKLQIESEQGKGSQVLVWLPKKGKKYANVDRG